MTSQSIAAVKMKMNEWRVRKKRLNIYVEIHYEVLTHEYETLYTCNVLTEEMTHK